MSKEKIGIPLKVDEPFVDEFVFGERPRNCTTGTGITPSMLERWSVDLVCGVVPNGFRTTEEFADWFIETLAKAKPKTKAAKRTVKRASAILRERGKEESEGERIELL